MAIQKLKKREEFSENEILEFTTAALGLDGKEINNPAPMSIPFGAQTPETVRQKIRRIIGEEAMRYKEMVGTETAEEARDLDIPEDTEPITEYEVHAMLEDVPPNMAADQSEDAKADLAQNEQTPAEPDQVNAPPDSSSGEAPA